MRLFERRLLIVGGKGGAGKSTVAASLALLAARSGLKTLLCELEKDGRLARLVGDPSMKRVEPSSKRIDFLYVDPEAALEEYLQIYLRFKPVYKPIAQSPIMNYFLRAAPGFRELLVIGKIWWELQLQSGFPRKHRWDLIIVDTPATGHGIGFMGAAQVVSEMVRIGPIRTQAKKMADDIRNEKITALIPVTLPEETPVNETVELVERARRSLGVNVGPVIVNCMPPQIFPLRELTTWRKLRDDTENDEDASNELRALTALGRVGRKRRESAIRYRRQLRESIPGYEIIDAPYMSRWNWNVETISEIAGHLRRGLDV